MSYYKNATGVALLVLTAASGLANAGAQNLTLSTPGVSQHAIDSKLIGSSELSSSTVQVCGTDENTQNWSMIQKHNQAQLNDKTSFANQLLNQLKAKEKRFSKDQALSVNTIASAAVDGRYYIPVVFHVYGSRYNCTNNGGVCLTDAKIIDGLNKTNQDFLGTNSQDGPIAAQFQAIRQNLNIEFVLAKTDPNGTATSGIVRHGEAAGYGDDAKAKAQISADAWDNFKYMNVYIMHDLYDDGATNNSGVAWYPQLSMSQEGLARVVYNGDYLGANTNENFRSVLTHEFGHWLNLPHVFDGDTCSVHAEAFCAATGDSVCDTPQMSSSILQDNTPNCMGKPTNTENFMHYSDNYAMYTQGQVQRMTAALHGPARATLWSNSNLVATGLTAYTNNAAHPWDGSGVDTAPQGTVLASFEDLSAAKGDADNYMIDVPVGTKAVAFYLNGFSEDPDLYVSKGTSPTKNGDTWTADHISFQSTGTPELVALTGPSSTETYHATVDAFTAYSNAKLQVLSVDDPSLCANCERVFLIESHGLAAAKGSPAKTYSFTVPSDATKTIVVMPGGYQGDPDLYVSVNSIPTTTVADCKPFNAPRMSEYCELPPGGGTVNILIDPFLEYSGATIQVYYERETSTGGLSANANGPYTANVDTAIQFNSSGSSSDVSFQWNFGDDTTSDQANPQHMYTAPGQYVAILTITDNTGASHSDSALVTVTDNSNPSNLPDACATQSPITGGRVENGVAVCLGQSSVIWLSMADVSSHQSIAITTGHGTGNLAVFYKNGGWPSESDNDGAGTNSGSSECIYLTTGSQYWSYFKITGNAAGATLVVDFDTPGCR